MECWERRPRHAEDGSAAGVEQAQDSAAAYVGSSLKSSSPDVATEGGNDDGVGYGQVFAARCEDGSRVELEQFSAVADVASALI